MSQSRKRIIGPIIVFVVICAAGVYLGTTEQRSDAQAAPADAQDGAQADKPKEKPAAAQTPLKTAASDADTEESAPTLPGPDATTEDLVKALQTLRETQLTATTQAEAFKQLTERVDAVIKISDRILKAKDADDEQTVAALMGKVSSYYTLGSMLGDESAIDKALELTKSYSVDKRETVAETAKQVHRQLKIGAFGQMTPEQRKEFVDELFAEIGDEGANRFNTAPLLQLSSQLDGEVPPEEGAAVLKRIAEVCKTAKDEQISELVPRLEGIVRRLELPGNKMEISGTTLDGKEFDWESYRGKVVLVDFWATWCGPCVQELPNVIANYKKYHDKGFDVVAVNLDDEPEQVRQFLVMKEIPWVNLFPPDEKDRSWNNPVATYYGIQGIPTAILVDRQGKVVSLNARGEALGAMLEQFLEPASK